MAIDKTYNFRLQIANESEFRSKLQNLLSGDQRLQGSSVRDRADSYTSSGVAGSLFNTLVANSSTFSTALEGVSTAADTTAAKLNLLDHELPAFNRYMAGSRAILETLYGETAKRILTERDINESIAASERTALSTIEACRKAKARLSVPGVTDASTPTTPQHKNVMTEASQYFNMRSTMFLLNNLGEAGKAVERFGKVTERDGVQALGKWSSAVTRAGVSAAVGMKVGAVGGPVGSIIGGLLGAGSSLGSEVLGLRADEHQDKETLRQLNQETAEARTAQLRKVREDTITLKMASTTNEDAIHELKRNIIQTRNMNNAQNKFELALLDASRAAELLVRDVAAISSMATQFGDIDFRDVVHKWTRKIDVDARYGVRDSGTTESFVKEANKLNLHRYESEMRALEDERKTMGMTKTEYAVKSMALLDKFNQATQQVQDIANDIEYRNQVYRGSTDLATQSIRARASEKLHLDYELRKLQGMPEDLNKARQEAETWKFLRDQGQALIAGQHRGPLSTSDLWNQAVAPTNELTFDHMAKAIDNLLPKLISGVDTGNKIAQSLMDEIRRIMNPRKPEQRDQWVVGRLHEEYDIKSPFKPNYWSFLHYTSLHDDEAFEDRAWALKEKSDDIINRRKLIDETMRHNPFQTKADAAEALAKHGVFNRLEPGTVDELMGRDAGKAFTGVIDTVKGIIDKVARVNEALADIRATKELDTYINNAANGYYGSLSDRARNKLLESDDAKWWGAVIKKLDDMINELRGNNAIHTAPTTFGD